MEAAIIGVIGRIAPLLFGFLHGKYKLFKGLEDDIRSITNEFNMISATIAEAGDHPLRSGGKVHITWIEIVRDLARDIEDCIDDFTHRFHKISTVPSMIDFAEEIGKLKKRSVEAGEQIERYTSKSDTEGGSGSSTLQPEAEYTAAPVGMEAARRELMELIRETPRDQPNRLKVISIVGFGGIGKSQLARYVYNTIDESEFPKKAWVDAAAKGAGDVLKDTLRQVCDSGGHEDDSSNNLNTLRTRVHRYLDSKRFFVVIDGLRTSDWDDIEDAFPVASGGSSRVIVTTDTHSIATKCSALDGHIYVMQSLNDKDSRELFFKKAKLHFPPKPDDKNLGSEVIDKCGGLPLALVTTARILRGNPTEEQWADLGKNLAETMEKEVELVGMQHVLDHSYTRLCSEEIKTCLLYLGIYPSGHPIRTGSLIRKWLAEGFIKENPNTKASSLQVAVRNFNELVDQSIIKPIIDVSSSNNSTVVKACHTHGMMLQFILHKSMCQNFVTLYGKDTPSSGHSKSKSKIRWLSVQHNGWCKIDKKDLHLVRSLTIFGEAHKSLLDFSKYKLMKVLDLGACGVQMRDSHLKDICTNLVLLRYLSLGATVKVTALPKEIAMLKLLETLDVRRTKIEILPTQVLELPCLVHLLGKLKLQENGIVDRAIGKLQDWLRENSKLETLAGFVVDENQEMPQLIEHMEHLTKLKLWCESTPNSGKIKHLIKAIKGFIERGTRRDNAPSLSLNFNSEWHQDLLYLELKKDRLYYIRSLKLQGNKMGSTLPSFVSMLGGLTKLCLSFPGHKLSTEFLNALLKVRCLEYLKLVARELGKLVFREDTTKLLRRLCVVADIVTGLETKNGALLRLESLGLLCKDLNGFKSTTIQSLPLLQEVTLHNGLSHQTKQDWIKEAKDHRRRPRVLFAETELIRSEAAVEITFVAPATDTTAQDVAMPANAIPTQESVTSEIASDPATTTDRELLMKYFANANAHRENNEDGQHDVREKKYIDNTDVPTEIASEPATTTHHAQKENHGDHQHNDREKKYIDSSDESTTSFEVEMGGKDQRMEDYKQFPAKKDDTQVTSAAAIVDALQMIPDLAPSDMLKCYGKLIHSERLVEAFMALPVGMKKEWLMSLPE